MWLFRRNWVTPKDIAKAEAGNKERERERERETSCRKKSPFEVSDSGDRRNRKI